MSQQDDMKHQSRKVTPESGAGSEPVSSPVIFWCVATLSILFNGYLILGCIGYAVFIAIKLWHLVLPLAVIWGLIHFVRKS
ncbi:MAG: hypothetical protein ACYDC1_10150 [Limisphaerales bacterium]